MLTHTPGTEADASRMSMRVHDIIEELQEELSLAQGRITKEDIEARKAAEDGVMRVVA